MQSLTPALAISKHFQRAMAYAITKNDVKNNDWHIFVMSELSIPMQFQRASMEILTKPTSNK